MRQSGVSLVEVGTTNRTYAADFEAAITERTALLLRVHASNFLHGRLRPSAWRSRSWSRSAHATSLAVVDDLGSGSLLDTARFGLAHEPTVQASVSAGTSLIVLLGRQAARRSAGGHHRRPRERDRDACDGTR